MASSFNVQTSSLDARIADIGDALLRKLLWLCHSAHVLTGGWLDLSRAESNVYLRRCSCRHKFCH